MAKIKYAIDRQWTEVHIESVDHLLEARDKFTDSKGMLLGVFEDVIVKIEGQQYFIFHDGRIMGPLEAEDAAT